MTMIRVIAIRDAFDRARDAINDPRVFDNEAVRKMTVAFERLCADASHPLIVDDPKVVTACTALVDAMTNVLFARAAAHAAGFFRMFSAHRSVYVAGQAAGDAYGALDRAIRDAWIAAVGFDPNSEESFRQALVTILENR
jgi:hypothetical protein